MVFTIVYCVMPTGYATRNTFRHPHRFFLMMGFRKQLVLPAEHGAWAWLLVPFGVGVAVGGGWYTAVTLVLLGSLAAFLARQPATVWLRVRQGKGRRSDGPAAATLTTGLSLMALLCLGGLLWLGYAQLLWLLLGLQNLLGVYYVRLRIADTHGRDSNRWLPLLCHLAGFILVAVLALVGWLPWLVTLPFAAFLLRAIWAWPKPRPVANIKRFGFLEVGVEIIGGLMFIAAF